jgi:hypothetical protein
MAIRATVDGFHYLVVFGGLQNLDSTVDLAFVFLRSPSPFAPGSYPVNISQYSAFFGFVDDASSIDIPDNPWSADWPTWIAGLNADHKLLAGSGAISLTSISNALLEGTFSGITGEFGGGILVGVTNGTFSLDPEALSIEDNSWGHIKALYH